MDIKQAVAYVKDRFSYLADKPFFLGDLWFVMPESADNVMRGDCDDFTITSIWLACDRSVLKFIWNVMILHRYRVYMCRTVNGGLHLIGNYKDLWFDNWTLEAIPEDEFFAQTGHKKLRFWPFFVPGPTMVLALLNGLWYRRRFLSAKSDQERSG